MGQIFSIVYQPEGQEYGENWKEYIRVPVERAKLIAGHGIDGDQKAGHNPARQLNILSKEWLDSLHPKGYKTCPGQFGEQIILSGIGVETLEPGTQLQLGRGARIEITKVRTGCDRLMAAQEKSIADLGPIGVLAKVITGGEIEVGDPVTILKVSTAANAAYSNRG